VRGFATAAALASPRSHALTCKLLKTKLIDGFGFAFGAKNQIESMMRGSRNGFPLYSLKGFTGGCFSSSV